MNELTADADFRDIPADVVIAAYARASKASYVDHPDNTRATVGMSQYQLEQALAVAYARGIKDCEQRSLPRVEYGAEPIRQAGEGIVAQSNELGESCRTWVARHTAYQLVSRRVSEWAPDSEQVETPDVAKIRRFVQFDDMTWPDPNDPAEVEWRLRYSRTNRVDLLTAASYIAAYRQLISDTQTIRNAKVRRIREAAATTREDSSP